MKTFRIIFNDETASNCIKAATANDVYVNYNGNKTISYIYCVC